MVNNTIGKIQIIATILGLIESTCIMAEVGQLLQQPVLQGRVDE